MDTTHPLRAYRAQHSPPLSQSDLAAMLQVARNTVSRWECGRIPDRKILPKVSEITGIPQTRLLNLEAAE